MLRFKTINILEGSEIFDYKNPVKVFGESVTDKSHFVPMSESVKSLRGVAPLSADIIKMAYDFPNGRDNGSKVPVSRNKGIDLAVLAQDTLSLGSEIDKALAEGAKNAKIANDVNSIISNSNSSKT